METQYRKSQLLTTAGVADIVQYLCLIKKTNKNMYFENKPETIALYERKKNRHLILFLHCIILNRVFLIPDK